MRPSPISLNDSQLQSITKSLDQISKELSNTTKELGNIKKENHWYESQLASAILGVIVGGGLTGIGYLYTQWL